MNRDEQTKKCIELGPWFHQIDLGEDIRTRDIAPTVGPQEHDHPASRWNKIKDHLPADMTGMRVLDVGCSDGYFSIEMARRNAKDIISVDGAEGCIQRLNWIVQVLNLPVIKPYYCSLEHLYRIRLDENGRPLPMDGWGRLFKYNALGWRHFLDPYGKSLPLIERLKRRLGMATQRSLAEAQVDASGNLGRFDFILMFALLYHLRDPLAGLEMVSKFSDVLYIETLVVRDDEHSHLAYVPPHSGITDHPKWYPTIRCLKDMLTWVGYTEIIELAPPTDGRPIYLARKHPASSG
jgi:SAM-dependent methyltransferase